MNERQNLPKMVTPEGETSQVIEGQTYRTSNTMLQAYTGEGELIHYPYNTQELADEAKVSVVNYNTGAEEVLTSIDYDLLDIFAELISPYLDDPKVQQYLHDLSSDIFSRQEESKGMKFEIEETKIPKLKNVTLKYLAQKKFNAKRVGGTNLKYIALALDSLSRKGCDFTFYRWNDKTKEKEVVLRLRSRFFHIKYHPTSKRTAKRLVAVTDEKGRLVRGKDKKVMKKEEDLNIYNEFDIVLEEEYFWFYGGYFLQPINIRAIKQEAKYPTNELANWLYFFLVGQRGNTLKWYIKRITMKEKELKQDESLTDEERKKRLKKEERDYLTIGISVKFIMERLKGSSYHKDRGPDYDYYDIFDEQLPEVQEGLKRVGLVIDYYVKGRGEDRVLYFVYNKEWVKDRREVVKALTSLPPSGEGEEVEK